MAYAYDLNADANRVLLVAQDGTTLLAAGNADDVAAANLGQLSNSRLYGFDGTAWDRLAARVPNVDNLGVTGNALLAAAAIYGLTPSGQADRVRMSAIRDLMVQQRQLSCVTNTGAAGAAVTLTIPAGGAGVVNYLSFFQIVMYATAARTGSATPVVVTTTGIDGTPSFTWPTAAAIGTTFEQKYEGHAPIQGTAANTTMTIVCPATTNVIWRVTATYFQA